MLCDDITFLQVFKECSSFFEVREMAQQKIMRSRLKKVLSSSTTSLNTQPPSSVKHSRRIEITLNPFFQFQWPPQQQQQQQQSQQQYQHLFYNSSGVGQRCPLPYSYSKDRLISRSLSDLRSPPFSHDRVNFEDNDRYVYVAKKLVLYGKISSIDGIEM